MALWLEWAPASTPHVVGAALLGAFLWWALTPNEQLRALRLLPRPSSTLPIVANTLDMFIQLPRLHDWMTDQCLQHGGKPWVLRQIGGSPCVVISSVALFEDVKKTQFEVFVKGPRSRRIFEDVARYNILTLDGDEWKKQRSIMNHLFTMRRFRDTILESLHKHLVIFGRVLDQEAARQQVVGTGHDDDSFYDMGDAFHRFSFDSFMKIAFGSEENKLEDPSDTTFIQALGTNLMAITSRFLLPDFVWRFKRFFNLGTERELRKAMKIADAHLFSIITETLRRNTARMDTELHAAKSGVVSRDEPAVSNDIVSLAVEYCCARMPKGAGGDPMVDDSAMFSKSHLRDIGLAIMTAGMDTTATALSWMIVVLAKHPHVVYEIRRELQTQLPRLFTDRSYVPGLNEIENIVYLEAAVRELIRLYPVVPLSGLQTDSDTTLCDGTFIKKGTAIFVATYASARMPSIWGTDASSYNPERWLEPVPKSAETGNGEVRRLRQFPQFQYLGFGGGPRVCVGRRYAMVNIKSTVAYLLSKYTLTPKEEPSAYTYKTSGTLLLKERLLVRVVKL